MTRLVQVRLAVALVAIIVWGYGTAVEDHRLTLAGMVLLAVSLLLRFLGPRPPRRGSET